MANCHSDQEIISNVKTLKRGPLYLAGIADECWRTKAMGVLRKMGATDSDCYYEGISSLYFQIMKEAFRCESTLETYFIGICKKIWLKKCRLEKKIDRVIYRGIENIPAPVLTPTGFEDQDLIDISLKQLGEPCQQIIKSKMDGYSLAEIAEITGLTLRHVTYRSMPCQERFIQILKNNGYGKL